MTEVNPSAPDPNKPVDSSHPASIPSEFPGSDSTTKNPGGSFKNMEKWLGPKGYKTFQQSLCKGIVSDIAKRKAKEQKIARQLRNAETGKDMYDA